MASGAPDIVRAAVRLPGLLILLALAVAALGGCAGGKVREANAYVSAVNRAQTAFSVRSDRLASEIGPDTAGQPRLVARRLDRYYATVDAFVTRLRAIRAPRRVQALHVRLIAAIERFGASLRSAGAGLTSGDASRILDGQQQLVTASATVSRAINRTIAAINASLRS